MPLAAVLYCLAVAVFICFAVAVFVGPPYLPTLDKQMETALDMLALKKGQRMIELGCGDGKVLVAAARRGWQVVGIEINPLLVLVCLWRTRHYRKQVKVVWGNYWQTGKWPAAAQTDAMFGFVLPRYMAKLDETLAGYQTQRAGKPPFKLASFAFTIPGRKAIEARNGVFLYEYK